MRRGNKSDWLINEENGDLVGVNLGSDFTAEHEHGIKELNQLLGIKDDESKDGIERRRVNVQNTDVVSWQESGKESALIVGQRYGEHRKASEEQELSFYEPYEDGKKKKLKENMTCAWSGCDLGIRVCGEKNIKKLKQIYEAVISGKAAVWLGGAGVFKNPGLVIAIIDNVPAESLKTMVDTDLDQKKLAEASEKTGIFQKLKAVNRAYYEKNNGYDPPCGYYACSPRWKNSNDKETKYEVVYFLNPMGQDKNNFGWFTAEDLTLWTEGKGPIPKK